MHVMVAATRIAVIAVASLTACSNGGTPTPDTPAEPAAASDEERLTVIQELRKIDTCALYGGAQTVAGQSMTVEGPTSFLGCDARIANPEGDVEVNIGVNVGPADPEQEEDWVRHRTIDGI